MSEEGNDAVIDLNEENASVLKMIEWFKHYFEPASPSSEVVVSTIGTLRAHFKHRCTEHKIDHANAALLERAREWTVRSDRGLANVPLVIQSQRAASRRDGFATASSPTRPPPFIALKNSKGEIKGYVRADRIETIALADRHVPTGDKNSTAKVRIWGASISMFNGNRLFTRETPDEVFAKMADALHMPRGDEE